MRLDLYELEQDPAAGGSDAPAPPPAFDAAAMTERLAELERENAQLQDELTITKTPAAPATAAAAPEKVLMPQFGTVEQPAGDSVPAISDEGGYVCHKPLMGTGAFGDDVRELAALLDSHGFANAVHAGKADAILDDALMAAVKAFQERHGIDPSKPQDGAAPLIRKDHQGLVDARTWEALLGEAPAVFRVVRHVVEEVA